MSNKIHIKRKIAEEIAEEIYERDGLVNGDAFDICASLEDAFMIGASYGSMDSDLAKEAREFTLSNKPTEGN